jgi:hypothetical protein
VKRLICGLGAVCAVLIVGGGATAHAEPLPCIDDFLPPDAKTGLCPTPTTNPTTTNAPTTTSVAPTTNAPTTNAPTTNAPTTNAPTTTAAPTTAVPTTTTSRAAEPSTVTFEIYAGRSGVSVDEIDIDTLGRTFGRTQLPFAQTVSMPSPVTSLRLRAYGNGQDKIGCRITVNGQQVVDVMNSAVAICSWKG